MLVSNKYTSLLEGRRRTIAVPRAGRREHVRPGFRCEQQRLQIGLRDFPQPPPLLDRQKHRRFHATPGHDLQPFPGARFEKRAEPGPGLLNLPCPAPVSLPSPGADILTAYMTTRSRSEGGDAFPTLNALLGRPELEIFPVLGRAPSQACAGLSSFASKITSVPKKPFRTSLIR